jgi:predicted ATPase
MRITRASIKNYRVLRDVQVALPAFGALVGPNGSGKSSFFEAIERLLSVFGPVPLAPLTAGGRPGDVFTGASARDRLRPPGVHEDVAIALAFDSAEALKLLLHHHGSVRDVSTNPWFTMSFGDQRAVWPDGPSQGPARALEDAIRAARLPTPRLVRLNPAVLAEPSYSEADEPRLGVHGEHLASVLQYLLGQRDGRFDAIEAAVATIIPEARRLRAVPAKVTRAERLDVQIDKNPVPIDRTRELTGAAFEVEWRGSGWIPAEQLSEGTLLTIGVMTALHERGASLLLIDDLDKGLHPRAQAALASMVRGLVGTESVSQVLATTHSPFVLDEIPPEEVLVIDCGDGEDGGDSGSRISPLTDHPHWDRDGGFMRPGEFWSFVGERWVADAGGRAA